MNEQGREEIKKSLTPGELVLLELQQAYAQRSPEEFEKRLTPAEKRRFKHNPFDVHMERILASRRVQVAANELESLIEERGYMSRRAAELMVVHLFYHTRNVSEDAFRQLAQDIRDNEPLALGLLEDWTGYANPVLTLDRVHWDEMCRLALQDGIELTEEDKEIPLGRVTEEPLSFEDDLARYYQAADESPAVKEIWREAWGAKQLAKRSLEWLNHYRIVQTERDKLKAVQEKQIAWEKISSLFVRGELYDFEQIEKLMGEDKPGKAQTAYEKVKKRANWKTLSKGCEITQKPYLFTARAATEIAKQMHRSKPRGKAAQKQSF
jgi:hypothetical protein